MKTQYFFIVCYTSIHFVSEIQAPLRQYMIYHWFTKIKKIFGFFPASVAVFLPDYGGKFILSPHVY